LKAALLSIEGVKAREGKKKLADDMPSQRRLTAKEKVIKRE